MPQENSINPELVDRIADLLQAGVSIKGAMRVVGKAESTYHEWIKRGKEGKSHLYVNFLMRTQKARGQIERDMVRVRVGKAKEGDNESIDKVLKQVNRKDYQDRVVVEQEIEKAMLKLKDRLEPEEYQKVMGILAED